MPLNIPGLLVPFQLLFSPRLVLPSLAVNDIRQLNFQALKRAGYRGAVFDKDNCLTIPHKDTLVPELEAAWKSCRETFGEGNVLIVSNSAGTYLDAGGIQSESVSYHLGVPVLSHKSFKPAYSCIDAVRRYFLSLPSPIQDHELIVVGDRIFTDVVLANRMRSQAMRRLAKEKMLEKTSAGESIPPRGPLAVWTTGVWKRESMLMRYMEHGLVKAVRKSISTHSETTIDTTPFINTPPEPEPEPTKKKGIFEKYKVSIFR